MKENAVIFYFRTGGDAFSQKIKRTLCIFSDSFVLNSCSCHVFLAKFRPSANLTGFHVFALMRIFAQILVRLSMTFTANGKIETFPVSNQLCVE